MGFLREDLFTRRGVTYRVRSRLSASLVALMCVSIGMLALSRMDHALVRSLRVALDWALMPAVATAMKPLAPLREGARRIAGLWTLHEEVERLRAENRALKSAEWRARDLEQRLAEVSSLARVVDEPAIPSVSGRVIADASGPFVRTAIVDVGSDHGARLGQPAISADGLVGRVLQGGRRASRLLLASDINSRIPVFVGAQRVRAIAAGDNGTQPRLMHLPEDAAIAEGEEVWTSGIGGVFPRGLRLGVVVREGGAARVRLHARLDELSFVSILLYEQPGVAISGDVGAPGQPGRNPRTVMGRPAGGPDATR